MRPAAVVLVSVLLTSCWVGGQLRYRDDPELTHVTLARGGREDAPLPNALGVVRTRVSGYQSCDALTTQALRELLAEARALGGTGVAQVKFRRRWHWSGREPICKRQLVPPLRLTVEVQGLAIRDQEAAK